MDTTYFKAESELSFRSVVTIRERIVNLVRTDPGSVFCLDLTAVSHCDSAGLALLIETKKLCVQQGKGFKLIGVPAKTQALAEFCGVHDILETIQAS